MIHKGRFLWPGVIAPVSGTYTISHGIAPGTAVLECLLQDISSIAVAGDLVITDDIQTILIPDCKVDKVRQVPKGDGFVLVLEILDWRWKWTDLGVIEGWYNQVDKHGKLRPYTIRSPKELAILCLEKMGVKKYEIDLPPGLTKAQGQQYATLAPVWSPGQNTAPTGTNQPVNWEGIPPALALSNLCHQYGRHIIPRLSDYTITIAIPGFGKDLPAGSIASRSPTLDSPETPSGVAVLGDYTRYQMRLLLEAVGEEWNGRYLPIKDLSYAPQVTESKQISTVSILDPVGPGVTYSITIGYVNTDGTESSVTYTYTTLGGDAPSIVADALADDINADLSVLVVSATTSGSTITIQSNVVGVSFSVTVSTSDSDSPIVPQLDQKAASKGKPWQHSDPPTFWAAQTSSTGVPVTNPSQPALTYLQAVDLARKSIFRTYRIANINVDGGPQIEVPGFGKLLRRQQLIITDHQVEQIVPVNSDLTLVESGHGMIGGQPYAVNLYDGYSRDKPAAVYGRIASFLQTPQWGLSTASNTPQANQIFVPFSVDPDNLLIRFASPVFIWRFGGIEEPEKLVLQCAVMVRDSETNAIERFKKYKLIAGGNKTNCVVRTFPDVQLNVIGRYTDYDDRLYKTEILENDPISRANYYLAGMEAQYFFKAAETLEYNGFIGHDLDGATTQMTWAFPVREGGCGTTISRNTEHEVNVPPYPARRRAENLSIAAQAAFSPPPRTENRPAESMWVRPPGFQF